MFYLQTKDGERFLTDANSDDKQEFEKILEAKLGKDAAELFDSLVTDAEDNAQELLHNIAYRYNDAIQRLDKLLSKDKLDREKLIDALSDLQQLYLDHLL